MRRIVLILISLAAICVIFGVVILFGRGPANPPKFVLISSQPAGPFLSMYFDWGGAIPIRDGEFWFWTLSNRTNRVQQFRYDLRRRQVVGELSNASPVFENADRTKLLCEGHGPLPTQLKWSLRLWLNKLPWAKGLVQRMSYNENFWILDLKSGSAVRIGGFSQLSDFGSSFVPAPGFRFGYNEPSTSLRGRLYLCDLEKSSLTTINLAGEPCGWWDSRNILYKDHQRNNFMLFDVIAHSTRTLFSAQAISNTLQKLDLPIDREGLACICHWNGHDNDVLFTQGKEKNWGQSFILRADRTNQTLKLLFRDFKFQWGGRFNNDMTLYVYQGERGQPGAGGDGSVFLRDLSNNSERTLVPADSGGQYSLPRFCDDGVIYWRKRQLWRVDFTGTNNTPLIP